MKEEFVPGQSHYTDCRVQGTPITFATTGRTVLSGFDAEHCEVLLEKGSTLLMAGAEFRHCRIVSRSSKPSHADGARFVDCAFEGVFEAWQFGGRSEGTSVAQCDFSQAELNDCELSGCDPRALTFRGFPCIVVLEPERNKGRILGAPWPKTAKSQIYSTTLVRSRRFPCAAVVIDAVQAARWIGTDPERLRLVAEALGDAAMF